jgi:hypothetical protein
MFMGEAMYAAPVAVHAPIYAMFGTAKTVKFNLRNDSKEVLKVKAGDAEMTLAPGKTVSVKLPVGTTVVAQEQTQKYHAGEVLTVVSHALDDSTVTLD